MDSMQILKPFAQSLGSTHLAELFNADPQRFTRFSRREGPLLLDFSKQRINSEVLAALCHFADTRDLKGWQQKLFNGDHINTSEDRPALHWALRTPVELAFTEEKTTVKGSQNVTNKNSLTAAQQQAHGQLQTMAELVARFHQGTWQGATGKPITDVVNLGVGGSHLGPKMTVRALQQFTHPDAPRVHFISTLDGIELSELLPTIDPQTTLFIISSKSFATVDTLHNATSAQAWLKKELQVSQQALLAGHFIGISASSSAMSEWGIPAQNQLHMCSRVGGRYSLWGVTGLPLAIAIGMAGFQQLLAGAFAMDCHSRDTPWQDNLPVLMALLSIWNHNLLGINTHVVLPYDSRLNELPAHLVQLEMESNGKRVSREGKTLPYTTSPIVFGDNGSNAQHSFYQLLHQGTQVVACDFIVTATRKNDEHSSLSHEHLQSHHQLTLANCLAQSRLLAFGDKALVDFSMTESQTPLYQRYKGNQPSSTLVLDELTPYTLGSLIALYEHKVFALSVFWQINPFDQWGVEMGKRLATQLAGPVRGDACPLDLDSSTEGLLNLLRHRSPSN